MSVPLNSKGRAYLGGIFDVAGRVVFDVHDDGAVTEGLMVDVPPSVAQLFVEAYGGKAAKNGWRIRGKEAERFADEMRHLAPRMRQRLELYLRGRRSLAKSRRMEISGRWITLPLSARDVQERRTISAQLAHAERVPQALAFPSSFLIGGAAVNE